MCMAKKLGGGLVHIYAKQESCAGKPYTFMQSKKVEPEKLCTFMHTSKS